MKNTMIGDFIRYLGLAIRGKIKVAKDMPTYSFTPQSNMTPFRYVKLNDESSAAPVRLRIIFRVRKMNVWQRRFIPVMSQLFYMGAPGFLEKAFYINESERLLAGSYLWKDRASVENYVNSYAYRFMKRNAEPDSVSYEIIERDG